MAQTRRPLLPAPAPTEPTGAWGFPRTGRSTRGPRRAAKALGSELGAQVSPLLDILKRTVCLPLGLQMDLPQDGRVHGQRLCVAI